MRAMKRIARIASTQTAQQDGYSKIREKKKQYYKQSSYESCTHESNRVRPEYVP